MKRIAFYIHGTLSSSSRWNNSDLLKVFNRIILADLIDTSFNWDEASDLLNNFFDRNRASEKLVSKVKSYIGKCDEIAFIGHSHGGNLAIQAIHKILNDSAFNSIKNIYLLTISTPVNNSYDYIIDYSKSHLNTENPSNWNTQNRHKVKHISLFSEHDIVSKLAYPQSFLNLYDCYRFNYEATQNIEIKQKVDNRLKPFISNKIDSVFFELANFVADGIANHCIDKVDIQLIESMIGRVIIPFKRL